MKTKLITFAIILLAGSLMCSFWCTFMNRKYCEHLEKKVLLLEKEAETKNIVQIESDEYQQVRTFVDIVSKWGALSTQEADTYINQLNEIIELQKRVVRITPSKQIMLRYSMGANSPSVNDFIQPYLSQGYRVKEIAGSSPVYILLEK